MWLLLPNQCNMKTCFIFILKYKEFDVTNFLWLLLILNVLSDITAILKDKVLEPVFYGEYVQSILVLFSSLDHEENSGVSIIKTS